MSTAILYLRQSKAKDDSISIDLQRAACLAHCQRQGYEVIEEVVEEGVSGFRDWRKRPEFHRVVESRADVVVVYRWSRLSRKRLDQAQLIDMLGTVESATEPIDPTTAGGRFAREQFLSFAAFESDLKSEQWKEALNHRAERGLPKNGQPRYGYAKREDGHYSPDPITGPILHEMYIRYIGGAGLQVLCGWLNDAGHTTQRGNAWTVQTLRRLLESGFGAGLLVQDTRTTGRETSWIEGAHDGVISRDEWQAYLDVRGKRKTVAPKRRIARWHLAGLAICGLCGNRMIVTTLKEGKSQALCSGYHNSRSCTGVWIKRQVLEHRVALWLGAHIEDFPERDVTGGDEANVVSDLEERLAGVQARLVRLAEGYADGTLDTEGYRGAQANALDERTKIETALRDAREEVRLSAPINIDEFSRLEVGDVSPGEWNTLLGRVLRRVEVFGDRLVLVPVVGDQVEIPRS
ncbi:recombinase family protein [Nocardioides piscis]|uniref:Recombinase family protein n=1 Tax=Nocardioides piscis TaxID=2714938 RepID=A0A6G7YBD0_9ACTN|nr:recombinase family protein [Nocardioides piscis]QIK74105.1 recombinase family protein [Nocardioides piscis]